MQSPIITLTTDFGLEDIYVGVMKGVILSIAPQSRLVDITHSIPPQDIDAGGRALGEAFPFFPPGTIHVAVVDPEVGGQRAALLVQAGGHVFIGPDNGIFSFVLKGFEPVQVHAIIAERYMNARVSATFHGRDVFAPAAAHLAAGAAPESLGPEVSDYVLRQLPHPRFEDGKLLGTVVRVDRFGNLITNLHRDELARHGLDRALEIVLGTRIVTTFARTYADAPESTPVCLFGSNDCLEIAVRDASAAGLLQITCGQAVQAQKKAG